ncbi:VHS domain-containing protein [Verticillium alfalfae VaMs.102]|uniref:VHS domain-containing protein n=1 Tax=Verticillium alfalfae (strain VaMs.102 / ATCC MYA-4576 / FGSC 10136) TaxID=526221 RepID=C9SSS0_VERA1|nr:VHS domain-containing protein [Verticillium alfalfae VaMs.102]EEY21835.1 VHS domain-containing protein [Verticillium alfalfae VaMs.102]
MSMFAQKKPYSAVTAYIERLTSESYEEDDLSGIIDLVEVIKLQSTGPTEAARAIRKKLKYGNAHRQLRALAILDGLILNAGPRFQRTFADEPLLERLRVCGTSDLSDPDVKKKCRVLFAGWADYKGTPGLERIAKLHTDLPKRKQAMTQERSKAVRETENPFGEEDEDEGRQTSPSGRAGESSKAPYGKPASTVNSFSHTKSSSASGSTSFFGSSKDKNKTKDKKGKKKPFVLEAEKENMKSDIAEASISTTNLNNALQTINREKERISDNALAVQRFEECKKLRRKILRYWLGSLLHANDDLVLALMTFEQLDRSIDADSDSDDELAEQAHMYRMATEKGKSATPDAPDMAGLNLGASPPRPLAPSRPGARSKPASVSPANASGPTKPPRPPVQQVDDDDDDEDDDDPFADKNAVATPALERGQPSWS